VVGQDDAIEALRFGLEVNAPGQNVFVRGLEGTGRLTLVRRLLQEIRPACSPPPEHAFVHNFDQPDRPRLLSLPQGKGRDFQRSVDELVDFIERLRKIGVPHVVVSFGNPYLISSFPEVQAYMLAWNGSEASQRAAARALLGQVDIVGRSPTGIPPLFEIGDGIMLPRRHQAAGGR